MTPTVSVLLPVYNAGAFLAESIGSVLGQSWRDFELVAVDDGSTDESGAILAQFAAADARVRVVRQPANGGLVRALNRGLEVARGRYIARQDADDPSLPERLARQVTFLEREPAVGIVGGAFLLADGEGRRLGSQAMPVSHTAIRWRTLFDTPFCHPAVMFRRGLVTDPASFYQPVWHCEDYDLWGRLLATTRGANLAEALVVHRVHGGSVSARYAVAQARNRIATSRRELARVLPDARVSDDEVETLHRWQLALPSVLGEAHFALMSYVLALLAAFGRLPGVRPAEVAALRRAWAGALAAALPRHRLRAAWRAGVLGELLRTAWRPVTRRVWQTCRQAPAAAVPG